MNIVPSTAQIIIAITTIILLVVIIMISIIISITRAMMTGTIIITTIITMASGVLVTVLTLQRTSIQCIRASGLKVICTLGLEIPFMTYSPCWGLPHCTLKMPTCEEKVGIASTRAKAGRVKMKAMFQLLPVARHTDQCDLFHGLLVLLIRPLGVPVQRLMPACRSAMDGRVHP